MKVIYEPAIASHAPELYRVDALAQNAIEGWDSFDDEAKKLYEADGYLVVRGALSSEQVLAAQKELLAMTLADDPRCGSMAYEGTLPEHLRRAEVLPGGAPVSQFSLGQDGAGQPALAAEERARFVRKFMDFTAQHPPLAEIAHLPALQNLIEALGGEPMQLFQEMALLKPPHGREKPWHQDHAYFNFPLTTKIVGVWIALEDVRPENGCMFVLVGGHWGGPRTHFMRRDWQLCDTESEGFVSTAVPMQAGDLLLFDGKLPHGTPINQTDETRWALQYHYLPQSALKVEDAVRLAAFGAEGKDVSC
jgi:phytanoyl-CoA hydroxylase